MDSKQKRRVQLDCLYDMFRDRIEEDIIYIVYTENEGRIDTTIDHLMSISACSFTGHNFERPKPELLHDQPLNGRLTLASTANANGANITTKTRSKPKVAENFNDGRRVALVNYRSPDGQLKTGDTKIDVVKGDNLDNKSNYDEDDDDERRSVDDRIESLRTSIENLLSEKRTCHDKASQYLSKKMFPVTGYYSELAGQYRRMIESKTRKLVDLLLLKSQDANTIDLHGLNPIQARLVVSELLSIRQDKLSIDKQGEASIDIITGWGKHSVSEHQHRIRPTIVALLREKGYEHSKLNRGALRVTLRR